MMSPGSSIAPVPGEDEEVEPIREVSSKKSRCCRDLFQRRNLYRFSQADYVCRGINFLHCISVGCDDNRVQDICHREDNLLTTSDSTEIIMEYGDLHAGSPDFRDIILFRISIDFL